eukprot:CAMPEP_0167775266 /NCGR_PEP_ID=MMETSP0111_2-20121227/2457_1 /TAXON_ID=91324 /ORGANISM="Lotharella globosa, Strain CCCM811" /LENGTH=188 /DNA_ID=CAMNT_0007665149 /DNA_START=68 /DNA_END=634 /DNA_ORIENTATION=+
MKKEAVERITFDDVRKLSKVYKLLKLQSKDHRGYIHELLEDSEVSFPEEIEEDNRDPAFLKKLEQLRMKAEHEYYFGPTQVKDEGVKSLSMELGIGLNIILLMGTSFFVMYYAGLKAFPDSKVIPVLMGAGGLVGILIIETVLIIMRDERENIRRKKKGGGRRNATSWARSVRQNEAERGERFKTPCK